MSKSVLVVSEPGLDGVFRHVEGLIDFLIENGWRVHFAYSSRRASDRLFDLIERVTAQGGRTLDMKISNSPELKDGLAWVRLKMLVREESPLVVHGHSSKGGALARLGLSIPAFYTPNAYYGMGYRQGFVTSLYNAVERFLGKRGITIHVSPEETDFAKTRLKLLADRMVEIPNAVDFNKFRPAENSVEKDEYRRIIGIPQGAWVLGSIGRVCYQKHPELLYEGFREFAKRYPDVTLCLLHVGDGPSDHLARLAEIAKRFRKEVLVVRPAYRPDPEVFYRVMDAFCLSSRYEGLPFTALEALAAGLPLVLTDGPGLRSFGSELYGFNSVYYGKVANTESLMNAIGRCYLERDEACNHRAEAEQHFSSPQVYGRIAELYENIVVSAQ